MSIDLVIGRKQENHISANEVADIFASIFGRNKTVVLKLPELSVALNNITISAGEYFWNGRYIHHDATTTDVIEVPVVSGATKKRVDGLCLKYTESDGIENIEYYLVQGTETEGSYGTAPDDSYGPVLQDGDYAKIAKVYVSSEGVDCEIYPGWDYIHESRGYLEPLYANMLNKSDVLSNLAKLSFALIQNYPSLAFDLGDIHEISGELYPCGLVDVPRVKMRAPGALLDQTTVYGSSVEIHIWGGTHFRDPSVDSVEFNKKCTINKTDGGGISYAILETFSYNEETGQTTFRGLECYKADNSSLSFPYIDDFTCIPIRQDVNDYERYMSAGYVRKIKDGSEANISVMGFVLAIIEDFGGAFELRALWEMKQHSNNELAIKTSDNTNIPRELGRYYNRLVSCYDSQGNRVALTPKTGDSYHYTTTATGDLYLTYTHDGSMLTAAPYGFTPFTLDTSITFSDVS